MVSFLNAASSVALSVGLTVDPNAGNLYQGRLATFGLTWIENQEVLRPRRRGDGGWWCSTSGVDHPNSAVASVGAVGMSCLVGRDQRT